MCKHSKLLIALLVSLLVSPALWAGKEFTAGANETVVPNQLIVKLQSGANINQILASVVPQGVANLLSSRLNSYLLQLPPGIQSIISKALAALPNVDYVEPNRVRKLNIGPPNDANYASQWALVNIQALQAWNYLPDQYLTSATAGTGRVKVAVLDTGVDCTHPDFKNLGGSSTDAALGGQLVFASSQALIATKVASPTCAWQDDHGHGTHTAGTIAAATNNGIGVASVGYPLQVIVYKILDNTGSGSDTTIAQAIEAATDAGAKVVSMSLGGAGYSQTLQNAIEYAWQHNTLVVSAAGNSGDNSLQFPGAANHGLGVAATDSGNARAGFSTFGNWVKIAAPGVGIISTAPTYSNTMGILNYASLSGTSMATPHVAAVAGLIYMANPNISAAAVAQRLQRAAQTPNSGWDQFIGYGVLNAAGALSGTLRATSLGSLAGQVVDSSGFPVTNATVIANGQSFTTANDGLFRIANLPAGTYTLTSSATGFSNLNMQAAVVAGSDTMLSVRMGVAVGQFTGTVTSSGVPFAGAVVEAISGSLIVGTGVTDANGTYSVYLPAGTYSLTVSAAGNLNNTVTGQTLSNGQVKTVNLTISHAGNITGVVKDSNGTPLANVHVDISSASFIAGATTDGSGNFSTIGLPTGTYSAIASYPGLGTVNLANISVNPNLSTAVTLQFSAASSTLTAGLVGYWNFDEGSGTLAHDTSGSGYNGNITGATWTTGKVNGGLSFNGSANSVVTPPVSLGTTFSISAWVNPAALGGYLRIAETQYGPGFFLGTNAAGSKYKFIVNNGTGATGSCGLVFGCAEGGTVTSGWHLVTATYDGALARLYVDAVQVITETFTAPLNTNLPLYIGLSYTGGNAWNGGIDEVRLYNRAITSTDVSGIFAYTGGPADTTPPSTPTGVSATAASSSQINVIWAASTDNVGVTGYRVFRNGTQVGTPATLSFSDTGLTAATSYSYTVAAVDAAGNVSTPSTAASATTLAASDTTPPTVSITAPTAGATVSGTITVTATAADNVGVADVQFQLDGVNLGADLTAAPYSISWDTTAAGNGTHNLTAIARDAAHNTTTSSIIQVTVNNAAGSVPTAGLIGYWNFDEGTGAIAHDTSGSGYTGTVVAATWSTGKINSGLSFNGTTSYVVTPSIPLTTFSISSWVNSAVTTQSGYTRIVESQYSSGFYLGTNGAGTKYKFIVNSATGSTGSCGLTFGCAEGGTITTGWHLVTGTFDGSTAKLYVDNVLVASDTFTTPANASFPLYIGRNFGVECADLEWGHRRNAAVQSGADQRGSFGDLCFHGRPRPTRRLPPLRQACRPQRYRVRRSMSPGARAPITWGDGVSGVPQRHEVGTPITLSFSDTGLTASTSYSYTVIAIDGAGNASTPSTAASATTSARRIRRRRQFRSRHPLSTPRSRARSR